MREVAGNQQARLLLERAALSGQISHAYLLAGPEQIGKTTLALAFVKLLECTGRAADTPEACGACAACRKIEHGNHPDVTLVEPPADKVWLPIESIRDLQHMANLAPYEGLWRAFVIPHAEGMRAEAMNALLKTLEEPPPGVVLLLTSAAPEVLLPTVISRCQLVPLHPLEPAEVQAALMERLGMAAGEAATLAGLAGGRLGWALEAAANPEVRERRETLVRQIVALAGATRDARMRQVASLGSDANSARAVIAAWTLWWRDVLLAAHGATNLASGGDARAAAERLGRQLGPERTETFLRRLLVARQQIEQNANPRLTLEVLALDMPEIPSTRAPH